MKKILYKMWVILKYLILFIFNLFIFIFFIPFIIICILLSSFTAQKNSYFMGYTDIAGLISQFSKILIQKKIKCNSIIYEKNKYQYNNEFVKLINTSYGKKIFRVPRSIIISVCNFIFLLECILFHDKIVFLGRNSLLPLRVDLILFKLLRKKTLYLHCGSEIRFHAIQNKINEHLGFQYKYPIKYSGLMNTLDFTQKLIHQYITHKFCHKVLTSREQETFLFKSAYRTFFPLPKDNAKIKKTNDIPIIVHAPSDRNVKGTEFVLKGIEKLEHEGCMFEFHLCENMCNSELMSLLEKSDIVIDQAGFIHGRFAIEACASSCMVIGGNISEMTGFEMGSPIVQFYPNSDLLADALRPYISDPVLRQKKMEECFQFWQEHYSEEAALRQLEGILDGSIEPNLEPFENQIELCLKYAQNNFQRFCIWLLLRKYR